MSLVVRFGLASLAMTAVMSAASVALADDRAPKVDTTQPTPVVYPAASQRVGEEGTVIVRVYVDDHGKPQKAIIAKSSGHEDLDTAAIETTMNWHFVPAIRGGSTTSDWASVQVVYKLPDSQPAPAASK